MFKTKFFSAGDIERGLLDAWLGSNNTKEQGMMVVGYAVFPAGPNDPNELSVTIKVWNRSAMDTLRAARTTIDEIPEDPTIQVDEE